MFYDQAEFDICCEWEIEGLEKLAIISDVVIIVALSAFKAVRCLSSSLFNCSSGKELLARGFQTDVELAAQLNCSEAVPELQNEAYVNMSFGNG